MNEFLNAAKDLNIKVVGETAFSDEDVAPYEVQEKMDDFHKAEDANIKDIVENAVPVDGNIGVTSNGAQEKIDDHLNDTEEVSRRAIGETAVPDDGSEVVMTNEEQVRKSVDEKDID